MNDAFTLDSRLEHDSSWIEDLDLCQVRRMNTSDVIWLVLIPRLPGAIEWFDLSPGERQLLEQEVNDTAQKLKTLTQADKINIATLGNMVSQLHVHVVARRTDDVAWPKPVWGNLPMTPLAPNALTAFQQRWITTA